MHNMTVFKIRQNSDDFLQYKIFDLKRIQYILKDVLTNILMGFFIAEVGIGYVSLCEHGGGG
jgi:hypothetical protein